MDRTPIKIAVTRQEANAQARNLMRVAARQGRRLSLVQALDEVAEVNGYRNMHEQKAAYRPSHAAMAPAAAGAPTPRFIEEGGGDPETLARIAEAVERIAVTIPSLGVLARSIRFRKSTQSSSPFFIQKDVSAILYNPDSVADLGPDGVAYGIAMMLYWMVIGAEARFPKDGDRHFWALAWNAAAEAVIAGFFPPPDDCLIRDGVEQAVGRSIKDLPAEEVYGLLLEHARTQPPAPMPTDAEIETMRCKLHTAMTGITRHIEARLPAPRALPDSDPRRRLMADRLDPSHPDCDAMRVEEAASAIRGNPDIGPQAFLVVADATHRVVAGLTAMVPDADVMLWSHFVEDRLLMLTVAEHRLDRRLIVVAPPGVEAHPCAYGQAVQRMGWLRVIA